MQADTTLAPCPKEPVTKEFTALGQFLMSCSDMRMDGAKMIGAMAYLVARAQSASPVATVVNDYNADGKSAHIDEYLPAGTKLYAHPHAAPQGPARVPLTDEQIEAMAKPFISRVGSHWEHDNAIPDNGRIEEFARAIEAAHNIK